MASGMRDGIVSMDMVVSEMLLTLGIAPRATANIPLYRRLVSSPAMPDTVADLGPLSEPNIEYLRRISPSLILMADWQAASLDIIGRIAPVKPLSLQSRTVPALDHTATTLRQLAGLCDSPDAAEDALTSMWAAIERTRTALSGFNRPVFLCRFNRDGRNLAVFGGSAMLGDVLSRIGLRNAFEGRVNALSGGATIPVAQLAKSPDAVIVHFDRGIETDAALARLADSPVWQALPFVRNERVVRIPVIYPTGGACSATRFAQALAATLPGLAHG